MQTTLVPNFLADIFHFDANEGTYFSFRDFLLLHNLKILTAPHQLFTYTTSISTLLEPIPVLLNC